MAKNKKNKQHKADTVNTKKSTAKSKVLNPFEIHVNKEKFKILGRKNKHDRGLPGVSRAKAQKKRKETLGREYLEKNKVNKFTDNRIGRGSKAGDDLSIARFAAEKLTQYKEKKKNLYNLNDDEVLTHRGQTLEEIEQFREPDSDEASDNDALDAEFTEAAHFGGGDGADKLDRKAALDDMIADAKRKKAEIAKEKDEIYEMTTKLDASYKNLIPLLSKMKKRENEPKPPPDDYDRALREMVFEPRGTVTDKLESEEEIQRKEKERLEKLERERLARMRGEDPTVEAKPTHRSADALDDGYFVESDNEETPTLAYGLNGEINATENDDDLGDETLEQHDEPLGADEMDDEENQSEAEEGEEEESSDDDSMEDLKYSESESEVEDEQNETEDDEKRKSLQNGSQKQIAQKRKASKNADEEVEAKRSQAQKQLPFTFNMPQNYDAFSQLLEKYPPDDQAKVVERIIKCHHPRLDADNKEKMVKLFTYMLQYVNDIFSDAKEDNVEKCFMMFDKISPFFYDLMEMNVERMAPCVLEVIKEKYEEYKKNPRVFPPLETIVYFKLVSDLFSTSDFTHPVVTPCFVFISHVLSRARIRNRTDVATGLFLVTLIMEYTSLSKRFLPAAVNFLLGTIYLSIYKRPIQIIRTVPPFQSRGPQNSLLAIKEKFDENITDCKLLAIDLCKTVIDDSFKVRALNSALLMLTGFIEKTRENVGLRFLLEPFNDLLEKIQIDLYPDFLRENCEKVQSAIASIQEEPLQRLVAIEKRPKVLRMIEPKIVPVYDDKRRPALSKEKEERVKLTHKIKRETKGAIREIRRDNEFIAKMQLKKQLQSDKERKEKVRRIYAEASIQQGELNALARSKKKTKF